VGNVAEYSLRVAAALRAALLSTPTTSSTASSLPQPSAPEATTEAIPGPTTPETPAEASTSATESAETSTEITTTEATTTKGSFVAVRRPVDRSSLRPLAEHVSVLHLPHVRPDRIPWLGASHWAAHWHQADPDASQFQWRIMNWKSPIQVASSAAPAPWSSLVESSKWNSKSKQKNNESTYDAAIMNDMWNIPYRQLLLNWFLEMVVQIVCYHP